MIGSFVFRFAKDLKGKMLLLSIVFSVMIFLVAIELKLVLELPFWLSYFETFVGEIVVMLVGIPVMLAADKAINFTKQMNA